MTYSLVLNNKRKKTIILSNTLYMVIRLKYKTERKTNSKIIRGEGARYGGTERKRRKKSWRERKKRRWRVVEEIEWETMWTRDKTDFRPNELYFSSTHGHVIRRVRLRAKVIIDPKHNERRPGELTMRYCPWRIEQHYRNRNNIGRETRAWNTGEKRGKKLITQKSRCSPRRELVVTSIHFSFSWIATTAKYGSTSCQKPTTIAVLLLSVHGYSQNDYTIWFVLEKKSSVLRSFNFDDPVDQRLSRRYTSRFIRFFEANFFFFLKKSLN